MVTFLNVEYASQYSIGPKNALTMNVVSQMKISNLTYTRSTEMFY